MDGKRKDTLGHGEGNLTPYNLLGLQAPHNISFCRTGTTSDLHMSQKVPELRS